MAKPLPGDQKLFLRRVGQQKCHFEESEEKASLESESIYIVIRDISHISHKTHMLSILASKAKLSISAM